MSKAAYPLKLPASVKAAAARLAKADGVSLNQFIAVAVAEKVGVLETAEEFLNRRAGKASLAICGSSCGRRGTKSRPTPIDAERPTRVRFDAVSLAAYNALFSRRRVGQ
jgi:hypothetical protein